MSIKIRSLKQDIETKEELWRYLRVAMEVELSTIPAYLCALYSIKPETNRPAYDVIQSVVIEEMLHLTLAGNVLNATGGGARVNDPEFVPNYPTPLPDSDIDENGKTFEVPLQPLTPSAIHTFLRIEQPGRPAARPKVEGWHTIGQFYDGLRAGLNNLCKKLGPEAVFNGDPGFQIRPEDYYGGAGKIIVVTDASAERAHERANQAFDEIVEQGEGLHHSVFDGDEIPGKGDEKIPVPAHYFRFQQIDLSKYYQPGDLPNHPTGPELDIDWAAVYRMRLNPSMSDYERGSEIREKMLDFNRTYMNLLNLLQDAFSGHREQLMGTVGVMYDLKYKAAALMKIPSGDGETTVGPSFEYLPPGT